MFKIEDSICLESSPLKSKEATSINDAETIWDFLVEFYSTCTDMINCNAIRPGKILDVDLANIFDEGAANSFPLKFMDRCWGTFMVSMYQNFGETAFSKSYLDVLTNYLHLNTTQYPTLLWLHHGCASNNRHLSSTLYTPQSTSTDLLKQTALWLGEAIDECNEEDYIDLHLFWDTKFGKHFRRTIVPHDFFKYNKAEWNENWLYGIFGMLTMLGLADMWHYSTFGSIEPLRYVRPTPLLHKVMKKLASEKSKATPILEPRIILDAQRTVARFTDPAGRAILLEAGARLISTNRVTIAVEDLLKSASARPLKTIRSRFLKFASIDALPPVWEKLFEDAAAMRDSVIELKTHRVFGFKSQDDYDRFREALADQGTWTRHIIRSDHPLILIENQYLREVLSHLSALGIKS